MRYLPLISLVLLFSGCAPLLYSHQERTPADTTCPLLFRPVFTAALYQAGVEVSGRHLSGLLIFKKMPDSSTRLVFTGETGFTFFDMELSAQGKCTIHHIIRQLNKKPVIRTLQKDFDLILMSSLSYKRAYMLRDSLEQITAFPQTNGVYYYVTDTACSRLIRMERASRTKVVVRAYTGGYQQGMPDTIVINHKNFRFDITLKRLQR